MTTTYGGTLALRVTGVLRTFNEAGLLTAADVHVAQRLGALAGETDESVLLAAALTVRSTRHGSVSFDLRTARKRTVPDADEHAEVPAVAVEVPWPDVDDWLRAVAASPFVGDADRPLRPLRLLDGALWLDRYWQQEQGVADELLERSADRPPIDLDRLRTAVARVFDGATPPASADQKVAAAVCALSRMSVLAGGPGTGKTTTVARLLAVLHDQPDPPTRVALAAPTGKAAARLVEAVAAVILDPEDRARVGDLEALTLHRLLGRRPGARSRFKHDRDNRLPYDVVVVDESSMVSLTLMARLLEALRPDARLVLVGDPRQLASVEAGAVLDDIVGDTSSQPRSPSTWQALQAVVPNDLPGPEETAPESPGAHLADGIAVLTTVHRQDAGGRIVELARAVESGSLAQAVTVLKAGGEDVSFLAVADDDRVGGAALDALRADAVSAGLAVVEAAESGDAEAALEALQRHRLLCAHRLGRRGVREWGDTIARWIAEEHDLGVRSDGRYVGQPLLVGSNDYDTGLFNGDTGVVVAAPAGPVAYFSRGGEPFSVPLARLGDVRPLHAMTVHRAQGSQFTRVTVLLPPATSPLGTRETLYTALTRAEEHVRVIGSAEAFAAAVERPAVRATGLRRRLQHA